MSGIWVSAMPNCESPSTTWFLTVGSDSPSRVVLTLVTALVSVAACKRDSTTSPAGPHTIGDNTRCTSCGIELDHVARLGGLDDPGSPALFANVSYRTTDGAAQFFVAPMEGEGEVLVYSSDGTFERTLGGTGQGPGQFSRNIVRVAVGAQDSLYVVDRSLRRLTVFSPELTYVRTESLPFLPPMDVWVLPDHRFLVQGWRQSQRRAEEQQGFHVYSTDRDLLLSVGKTWRGTVPRSYTPQVADVMADNSVWTAMRRQYRLSRWSLETGTRLMTLIRNAAWFPGDTTTEPRFANPYTEKPAPYVQGLVAGRREGYLWVLVDVADRSWKPRDLATETTPLTPENADFNGVFDSVVEVIDIKSEEVVARQRTDAALRVVRGNDDQPLFFSYDVTESGVPVIHVWKPHLNGEGDES